MSDEYARPVRATGNRASTLAPRPRPLRPLAIVGPHSNAQVHVTVVDQVGQHHTNFIGHALVDEPHACLDAVTLAHANAGGGAADFMLGRIKLLVHKPAAADGFEVGPKLAIGDPIVKRLTSRVLSSRLALDDHTAVERLSLEVRHLPPRNGVVGQQSITRTLKVEALIGVKAVAQQLSLNEDGVLDG